MCKKKVPQAQCVCNRPFNTGPIPDHIYVTITNFFLRTRRDSYLFSQNTINLLCIEFTTAELFYICTYSQTFLSGHKNLGLLQKMWSNWRSLSDKEERNPMKRMQFLRILIFFLFTNCLWVRILGSLLETEWIYIYKHIILTYITVQVLYH